jgi:hypothetical protein
MYERYSYTCAHNNNNILQGTPLLKTWGGTYVIASRRAPFFIFKSWLEAKHRQEQQEQGQKQKRHMDSNSSSNNKDKQEE